MRMLQGWIARLLGIFRKDELGRQVAEEMQSHMEMEIADRVRGGQDENTARREVLMRFHGVDATKERYREQGGVPAIEHFVQDVRYALRTFCKERPFALTATLVLTLGFAASLTIFALVDAALITPLPYRDPNRLMFVTSTVEGIRRANISYLDFVDWKKDNNVFSGFDVYRSNGYLLANERGSELVRGGQASAGFFRTLGVSVLHGRDFYDGEDAPQAAPVVMLSYPTWLSRYGGKPDVVGQTVRLDGVNRVIIGVLPRDFHFALRGGVEFWTPFQPSPTDLCAIRRSCHNLDGVARLKDGVTEQAALADLNLIARRLEALYPESNRGRTANVLPLSEAIVGELRPILLIMLGGALLLLVIGCVNVASLLLVRSEGRNREMAVRVALGASPRRLLRQFVAEGIVLVGVAGALALLAARWSLYLIAGLVPARVARSMPFLNEVGLSTHVIAVSVSMFIVIVVIFSLIPLTRIRHREMQEGLKQGANASAGHTWRRFAANLVVLELAITIMLLVGAGLLSQSLYKLLHVELGFEAEDLVTVANVVLPDTEYKEPQQIMAARKRILDAVQQLPGVKSAALASQLPTEGNGNTTWIRVMGHEYHGEHNEANERQVGASYFPTLKARLLTGRYFTEAEDIGNAPVAVINQAFVKKYMPGEDPIGKKIAHPTRDKEPLKEVIGMVEDIRESSLDDQTWPTIYVTDPDNGPSLLVRTDLAPESMIPTLAGTIRQINPNIGTSDYQTMVGRINNSQTAYVHRSAAALVSGFAGTALIVSVVGLYGVIAYSVGRRAREIGIRMALGARRTNIYRLVMAEAGWLVCFGLITGILGAAGTSRMVRALLFGVGSWDARTFAGVIGLLCVAALAASYFPARRAASIDPMDVLRAE
jgi:macrolide transport system ATP-binding/permease protein